MVGAVTERPPPRLVRLVSVAVALAGSLAVAPANASASPGGPTGVEVVERDRRVFMMTDSVGLGVRGVLQQALPEYQVVIDGYPALMVDQLEERMLRPRIAARFDRSRRHRNHRCRLQLPLLGSEQLRRRHRRMISSLRAGGVQHIIWVTLREVKPEYISDAAWRQIQPYFWYFPRVNEHLRGGSRRATPT